MSETIDFWEAFGAEEETLNQNEKQIQELKTLFWESISQEDISSLVEKYDEISTFLKSEHKTTLISQFQENTPLDTLKINKIINAIKEQKDEKIVLNEEKTIIKVENVKEQYLQKQQETLNRWLELSKEMNLPSLNWYQELKTEAEKQVLLQNPELKNNPQELEKYTNTFILTYNQEELFAQNPWLKDKYGTQLEWLKEQVIDAKLFSWVELNRKYTNISEAFANKPWVLKSEISHAQELLRADGGKLKIEWNQIISWQPGKNNETQIITIDENGVQKSISKYWYKINVPSMVSLNQESKREINTLKQNITQNNATLKHNNEIFASLPKTPEFGKNDIANLQANPNLPKDIALHLSKYDDIQTALERNHKQKAEVEKTGGDTSYIDMVIELGQKQLVETQKLLEQEFQKLYESNSQLSQKNQIMNTRLQELTTRDFQNGNLNKENQQQADNKARETLEFLNILWITNINQNDLQQIINRMNIHPHAYWFSKPFDLNEWLSGTPTDALKQKKEFFNLFSKIYEKAWFIPPPNESIIQGFTKDPRLSNETIFKQKLEDAGLTKWGWLQIESVMKVLWQKNEKVWA